MTMTIYDMPQAARAAFEAAHQARAGTTRNRTRQKQTTRNYRTTREYMQWRDDERTYRKQCNNSRRADIQAMKAKTFLHAVATPKETERRLELAHMKATARKIHVERARSPERQREKLQRLWIHGRLILTVFQEEIASVFRQNFLAKICFQGLIF